ncbi:Chlorite dismutase [Conexibacter woesei DSM 14684]|uniref:Coproheme decarboxylase n=1 Tax=Conexibacter woesei (strain DSM 14684 / CCUG 47730 / CIP 108061 / JCM 11494 / NBRC 100937 / ID131577) TaxID=469383 RepID=D3F509_CONWI|nr:hydrogen peroxide-dependent heme synthase [Conexibacter woesei]ADB48587.1 Chlorite dismutase [Conexibacter woesei DSM 14684]
MTTDQNLYTLYAAFGAPAVRRLPEARRAAAAEEAQAALDAADVVVRGSYSLAGFRAEADLLLWLVAASADALQDAVVAFRHTELGRSLDAHWTNIGVHREAEFAKSHIPAYLAGKEPGRYVCVYPFVRSLDWYLLEPDARARMLREHGMMGRDYPDVLANTVSAFALGDYEWLLAFEAEELTRIVDLMRHLRAAEARRHTREELPFFTGIRKGLADVVADLP